MAVLRRPRNGKNISGQDFVHALEEGYNCSGPLAYFLSYAGILLLGQYGKLSLEDLARHNRIEHDASLVHLDAGPDDEYAPTEADVPYLDRLLADSHDGMYLTTEDIATARVRREATYKAGIDTLHQELAKGESALMLGIFGKQEHGPDKVPLNVARTWFRDERLPDGWKPVHKQTFFEMVKESSAIRTAMALLRKEVDGVKAKMGDESTIDGSSR